MTCLATQRPPTRARSYTPFPAGARLYGLEMELRQPRRQRPWRLRHLRYLLAGGAGQNWQNNFTATGANLTTSATPTTAPPGQNWYFLGTATPTGSAPYSFSINCTAGTLPGAVCVLEKESAAAYDLDQEQTALTDSDNNATTSTRDSFGRAVAGCQGQVINSVSGYPGYNNGSWTFSNLVPNSQSTYNVYIYSTTTPNTVLSANAGTANWLPSPVGGTSLGGNWYLAGTVTTSATSLTLTLQSGTLPGSVCLTEQTSAAIYDADGDLVQTTNGDGQVTAHSYDSLNRETGETWYPAGSNNPYGSLGFTYDLDGEMLTASEQSITYPNGVQTYTPVASYTYTYNSLGEALAVNNNGTGLSGIERHSAGARCGAQLDLRRRRRPHVALGHDWHKQHAGFRQYLPVQQPEPGSPGHARTKQRQRPRCRG